eukprot:tig00020510_g9888.t1
MASCTAPTKFFAERFTEKFCAFDIQTQLQPGSLADSQLIRSQVANDASVRPGPGRGLSLSACESDLTNYALCMCGDPDALGLDFNNRYTPEFQAWEACGKAILEGPDGRAKCQADQALVDGADDATCAAAASADSAGPCGPLPKLFAERFADAVAADPVADRSYLAFDVQTKCMTELMAHVTCACGDPAALGIDFSNPTSPAFQAMTPGPDSQEWDACVRPLMTEGQKCSIDWDLVNAPSAALDADAQEADAEAEAEGDDFDFAEAIAAADAEAAAADLVA